MPDPSSARFGDCECLPRVDRPTIRLPAFACICSHHLHRWPRHDPRRDRRPRSCPCPPPRPVRARRQNPQQPGPHSRQGGQGIYVRWLPGLDHWSPARGRGNRLPAGTRAGEALARTQRGGLMGDARGKEGRLCCRKSSIANSFLVAKSPMCEAYRGGGTPGSRGGADMASSDWRGAPSRSPKPKPKPMPPAPPPLAPR